MAQRPLPEASAPDTSTYTPRVLLAIYATRTVLNAPFRLVYPFLPSVARGLGISLAAATRLATLRVLFNLAAPITGPVADRRGRHSMMEFALAACAVAGGLLALRGTVLAASLAFVLYGLAKAAYDPAMHAYVADAVPYAERGRAAGIAELSWSSAWLIGVPVSGALIERWGWRSPWGLLAVLSVIGVWLIRRNLPRIHISRHTLYRGNTPSEIVRSWMEAVRRPQVFPVLWSALLLTLAVETPLIVYGAWLEEAYGLSTSALGLVSMVIGAAELGGEAATVWLTDRIGKVQSVLLGMSVLAAALLLTPSLASLGLGPALLGLATTILGYEYAYVSFLPIVSEIVPESRATLLGLYVVSFSIGRAAGSALGGGLWWWQSITPHCVAGTLFAILSVAVLRRAGHNLR